MARIKNALTYHKNTKCDLLTYIADIKFTSPPYLSTQPICGTTCEKMARTSCELSAVCGIIHQTAPNVSTLYSFCLALVYPIMSRPTMRLPFTIDPLPPLSLPSYPEADLGIPQTFQFRPPYMAMSDNSSLLPSINPSYFLYIYMSENENPKLDHAEQKKPNQADISPKSRHTSILKSYIKYPLEVYP